ncbi:MAG: InlB B-repeat-containing protein, partial [Clostridia bacterium]|nr:InlB B-repeat-containing protein [Clostridia bacterium]
LKSNLASNLIENEKYSNYVNASGKTGKTYFVGPINLKIPAGTSSAPINNKTIVEIIVKDSNGTNHTYSYKGSLYTLSGDKMKYKYSCSGTDLDDNVNDVDFYIPQNSIVDLAGKHDEYNIKFTNTFNYYQARLLYFYQTRFKEPGVSYCNAHDVAGQNKSVMRGRQRIATSSATITWKPATTVEINKTVNKINNNSVSESNAYIENGDTIEYKVTLKCTRGKVTKIEFTDQFENGKLNNFFDFDSNSSSTNVTRSGNEFTYSNTLNRDESVDILLRYKVKNTLDNYKESNRKISNTVKITKVWANNFKSGSSKLTDSADVYMKMYKVSIIKYITKVEHNGNVTYDRSGNTDISKFGTPIEVEVGDKVYYQVKIKNSGDDTNKYGKIKVNSIVDIYDKSNFKTSSTDVCNYNKANGDEKIYENPVDKAITGMTMNTNANLGSTLNLDGMKMQFNSLGNAPLGERLESQLSVIYTDGVEDEVFEDQQYYYNEEDGVPAPNFTIINAETNETTEVHEPIWENHVFKEWVITDDENGEEGDKIYTARWNTLKKVIFTDGVDDEEIFEDRIHYYEEGVNPVPTPDSETNPERAGYRFDGWEKKSEASSSEGDIIYYAKWSKLYSVTYKDAVNGEVFEDQQHYYNEEDGVPAPNFKIINAETNETTVVHEPKRDGYRFDGWEKKSEASSSEEDIIYYAKWSKLYSVTYMDAVNGDVFEDIVYYYVPELKTETVEQTSTESPTEPEPSTNTVEEGIEGDSGSTAHDEQGPGDAGTEDESNSNDTTTEVVEGEQDGGTGESVYVTNLPKPKFKVTDGENVNEVNFPHRQGYTCENWIEITDTYNDKKLTLLEKIEKARTFVNENLTELEKIQRDRIFVPDWIPVDEVEVTYRTIRYVDGQSGNRFDDVVITNIVGKDGKVRNIQDGDTTPPHGLSEGDMKYEEGGKSYVLVGWNPELDEFVSGDKIYTAIWKTEEDEEPTSDENPEIPTDDVKPDEEPEDAFVKEDPTESYSLELEENEQTESVTITYAEHKDSKNNINVWGKKDGDDKIIISGNMDKANHTVAKDDIKAPNGRVTDIIAPNGSVTYDSSYYVDFSKNTPTNQVMNLTRIVKISMGNGNKTLYYSQNCVQGTNEATKNLMSEYSNYMSADYIKIKPYSVTINKSVCAITDKN